MAIDKSLKESEKLGGIPKSIVVDPLESVEIIRECHELHKEGFASLPKFEHNDKSNASVKFKVYGVRKLSNDDILEIVNQWNRNEIIVKYNEIPIVIERKKKEIKKEETTW